MNDTGSSTVLHWKCRREHWSVTVPVPEAERRHLGDAAAGRRSGMFEVAALHVCALSVRLAGPNLRQDGTTGARTLSKQASREEIMRDYPLTWAAAVTALDELTGLIREDARLACAGISQMSHGQEQ
jgi:hypothetical protein